MRREYPERPIMCVAAVAFDSDNRVLLVRRAQEPSKGVWAVPGGVVELGETLHAAVEREILEETGIRVRPLDLVTIVERVVRDDAGRVAYHYVIGEYLCAAEDGAPRPSDDVDRAAWVPLDALGDYSVPAQTQEVIRMGWRMLQENTGDFGPSTGESRSRPRYAG